jgi:hypothetical protein
MVPPLKLKKACQRNGRPFNTDGQGLSRFDNPSIQTRGWWFCAAQLPVVYHFVGCEFIQL